jgi:signal transduction histidine kinase
MKSCSRLLSETSKQSVHTFGRRSSFRSTSGPIFNSADSTSWSTKAVEVARTNRKKEVEITAVTPGDVLVEMDDILVQRLLANLISNAVDAAPAGSEIRVELDRLGKTEGSRDWMRIRVVDRGEGIPKENLERVLTPYFTTKNRGDEGRGFGLGLAICRKIVALHGGKLSISSEVRNGTTVQIDLPARQVEVSQPAVTHAV